MKQKCHFDIRYLGYVYACINKSVHSLISIHNLTSGYTSKTQRVHKKIYCRRQINFSKIKANKTCRRDNQPGSWRRRSVKNLSTMLLTYLLTYFFVFVYTLLLLLAYVYIFIYKFFAMAFNFCCHRLDMKIKFGPVFLFFVLFWPFASAVVFVVLLIFVLLLFSLNMSKSF